MKVKIAERAGFCMGVRRAVNLVVKAVNQGRWPIYTYGPLIHNPQTLELLSRLGVKVLKHPEEGKKNGVCVIRAHGIPPQERVRLRESFDLWDGTCPRVLKVQALAEKAVREGKSVIIIGDADHAEVKGILGYTQGKGYVVSSLADLQKIPSQESYVVLSQTTQDEEVFALLAEEIVSKFQEVEVINTICNATEVRQAGVRKLCKTCEAIVVVGGKFSANTKRLAQIAEAEGKRVYFIERPEELPMTEIKKIKTLGVTAGASTPNWLINSVVDSLKRETSFIYRLIRPLMISQIYLALFIPLLLTSLPLLGRDYLGFSDLFLILFALFLSIFRVLLVNFLNHKAYFFYYPEREEFYRNKGLILLLLSISLIASFFFGLVYQPSILIFLLLFPLLDKVLQQCPFQALVDPVVYLSFVLYLYPLKGVLLYPSAFLGLLVLLFVKLYLEMVYLQMDGFLPKNFLLGFLAFDERRAKFFLKLLFSLLLVLPFVGLCLSWRSLFYLLPTLGSLVLFQSLLKRRLGQVVYLEMLSLIPPILHLVSSLLVKI